VRSGIGASEENVVTTMLIRWSDGGILRTKGASDRPDRDAGSYPKGMAARWEDGANRCIPTRGDSQ
jgi:hypothetical protein